MRWTLTARRRTCLRRTAKSCGPGASTPASSFSGLFLGGDGDKPARSPGRARRKPLKPSACGNAGLFRWTCGDYARVLCFISHARLRVHWAPGIPHALWGGWIMQTSGAVRRGNAESCSSCHRPRPGLRQGFAGVAVLGRRSLGEGGKRAIQYSRDVSDRTEKPRRTGYPACAGYDDRWWRYGRRRNRDCNPHCLIAVHAPC